MEENLKTIMVKGIAHLYQIRKNLWVINEIDRTLIFVYCGERKVLLLDTGFGLLDLHGVVSHLCPGKDIVVVNTHAHGDHMGGNGQFENVFVGSKDMALAETGMSSTEVKQFREHFLLESPYLNPSMADAWNPKPALRTTPLYDGDVIELGGISLTVIETPGHTKGSICLFDEENGYLFSGDMMLTWGVWGHLMESAVLSDYGASIHRLRELGGGIKEIFPSHGKIDNPYGWPIWHLDPHILAVYDDGIQSILKGKLKGEPYSCFLGDGKQVSFDIGGITYREDYLF